MSMAMARRGLAVGVAVGSRLGAKVVLGQVPPDQPVLRLATRDDCPSVPSPEPDGLPLRQKDSHHASQAGFLGS